jgi:hypothetical protein
MGFGNSTPQIKSVSNLTPEQKQMASALFNQYFQQNTGGGTSSSHNGVGHHPISYPQQSGFSFNNQIPSFNGGLGAAAPAVPEWSRLYNANNKFDTTGGALGQQSNQTVSNIMGGGQAAPQSQLPQATSAPGQVQAPNVLDPSHVQDWFQQSVVNPSMLSYQQNIAPAIDSSFAGQGGIFNSRRGYAQSQALNQIQTQNAASLANTSLNLNQQQAGMDNTNALQHNQDLMNTGQFNSGQQLQNNQFNSQLGLQNNAQQLQAALAGQQNINNQQNRLSNQFNMNNMVQGENNYTMQGQFNEMNRTSPWNNPYLGQAQQFMQTPMQTQIPYTPQSTGSMIGQGLGLGMMGQSMGMIPSAGAMGSVLGGDASLSMLGLPLIK